MENIGSAILVLSTCVALLVVPDFGVADLGEPTIQAALGTAAILTVLVTGRLAEWPPRYERRVMALFLAAMPTVYLLALAVHGGDRPWPMVELAGQILFAGLALAGVVASPWFLVIGVAAHGLLWDLAHLGRTSFMPDWYAVACLAVDVGWAVYAATRVPVWMAAEPAAEWSPVAARRAIP